MTDLKPTQVRQTFAETKNGWTRWFKPQQKSYRVACCDCGLVHEVDFRVRHGDVEVRVRRDKRWTSLARKFLTNFKRLFSEA
jgi:hypothetical protein